ncbi:MAG: hypothetical protein LBR55_00270 [Bacteroidales bacterium]|jgi:hypothetical protein|nr:hypothetical protein [Bacteroidales bacterium]
MYKIQQYAKFLFVAVFSLSCSFFTTNKYSSKVKKDTFITFYSPDDIENIPEMYISKKELFEKIAHIESRGQYDVANASYTVGKYQASRSSLQEFGYSKERIDSIFNSILAVKAEGRRALYYFDVELFDNYEQERFIVWYMKRMEKVLLKEYVNEYVGTMVNGVRITKAGILHASMLGAAHVQRFFDSNGKVNYTPKRGPSVQQRLERFETIEIEES